VQAITFVALPFVGALAGLLLVLAPMSLGSGLTTPSLSSLLSRLAAKEELGGTLGVGESASALGRIVGPEAGTYSYVHATHATPYLGGGALMALAAVVAFTLRPASIVEGGAGPRRGA
jgi:MFS family permease